MLVNSFYEAGPTSFGTKTKSRVGFVGIPPTLYQHARVRYVSALLDAASYVRKIVSCYPRDHVPVVASVGIRLAHGVNERNETM